MFHSLLPAAEFRFISRPMHTRFADTPILDESSQAGSYPHMPSVMSIRQRRDSAKQVVEGRGKSLCKVSHGSWPEVQGNPPYAKGFGASSLPSTNPSKMTTFGVMGVDSFMAT